MYFPKVNFQKLGLKKTKGFGMIEVLLATVILGVGVVGVAQFQGTVYKGGSLSKQRAEALKIAEQKLEELRHFSTALDYEQKITSNLSGIDTLANTSISNRTTAVYTLKAYAAPDSNGRSANLSVKVTWPDLTAQGSVTPSTTVKLSTIISNTTPNALAMTPIAPGPLPSTDADTPPIPVLEDPSDTTDLTFNNPEACSCQTIATKNQNTLDSSGFVKVMMRSSTTTTTTTSTLTAAYCDVCCDYAIPGTQSASLSNNERYYADFKNKLKKFMTSELEDIQKTNLEDRSVAQNQFNPAHLIKGYQSKENFYEKFLRKTGMMGNGTQTTTEPAQWALCSYVTVTTSTTTTIRGCKVWASKG